MVTGVRFELGFTVEGKGCGSCKTGVAQEEIWKVNRGVFEELLLRSKSPIKRTMCLFTANSLGALMNDIRNNKYYLNTPQGQWSELTSK